MSAAKDGLGALRLFARHLKGKGPVLAALFGLGIAGAAASLATPLIGKRFIDLVVLKGQFSLLPRLALALLLLALLDLALRSAAGLIHAKLSAALLVELRQRLFRRCLHAPLEDLERYRQGDLMNRFGSDLPKVQTLLVDGLLGLCQQLLFLLVAAVILVRLSLPLALWSFLGLALSLVITASFRGPVERGSRSVRDAIVHLSHFLTERLGALRAIRLHRAEPYEQARFAEGNAQLVRRLLRFQLVDAASSGSPSLVLSLTLAWIYFQAGALIQDGSITAGTFVAFLLYQGRLVGPALGLLGLMRNLQEARVSLERLAELLEDEVAPKAAPPRGGEPGCLALREVSFRYPLGEKVLDRITLRIAAGERVALFGASGSGKSTLVQLLFGLRQPQEGWIELPEAGAEPAPLGYAGADPFLMHASVEDNLLYGNPDPSPEGMMDAAALARAHSFICDLPQGYQTVIGGRGTALSDGQRQRIGLARLILQNPRFLVLDEAFSGLDPETEAQIRFNLWHRFPDRGFLVITHRLQGLDEYDRLYLMRQGRIREVTRVELEAELGAAGGRNQVARRQQAGWAPTAAEAAPLSAPRLDGWGETFVKASAGKIGEGAAAGGADARSDLSGDGSSGSLMKGRAPLAFRPPRRSVS